MSKLPEDYIKSYWAKFEAQLVGEVKKYPPTNITKRKWITLTTNSDIGYTYTIEIACAGLKKVDATIINKKTLRVTGERLYKGDPLPYEGVIDFLARGLSFKDFKIDFTINERTQIVDEVTLENGILTIVLGVRHLESEEIVPLKINHH